jgi:hypothetical protein
MKRLAKLFALAILALACDESGARESMRVLFVGNSLTYYNNLPGMVESIYESSRPNATLHAELLAPVCQADWTGHGPSENSLASRQEQPPAKCYSLSEAEFNQLRAAAAAR